MPFAVFGIAEAIGRWVLWAVVSTINVLVAAVGAVLQTVLGVLPSMPDPPDQPAGEWVGWLNWLVPVAEILAMATVLLGAYVVFLLVKVALNWVKAL
jgi:hypothetical protein